MSESGSLALFESFCATFAAMAKLFEARAAKCNKTTESSIRGFDQYWRGMGVAYADAAKEIRETAAKLRKP